MNKGDIMRRISIALLLVVTLSVFATGCGSSAGTPDTTSGGDITGIWTRILSTSQFQASIKLTIGLDGTFAVDSFEYVPGFTASSGQYYSTNDSISFAEAYCPDSGVYTFSITDSRLHLFAEHDSCIKRRTMLGGTWTRLADQ